MRTNYTTIWNYISPPRKKKAGYATDTHITFSTYFRHVPFVVQIIDWYEYFWLVSVEPKIM